MSPSESIQKLVVDTVSSQQACSRRVLTEVITSVLHHTVECLYFCVCKQTWPPSCLQVIIWICFKINQKFYLIVIKKCISRFVEGQVHAQTWISINHNKRVRAYPTPAHSNIKQPEAAWEWFSIVFFSKFQNEIWMSVTLSECEIQDLYLLDAGGCQLNMVNIWGSWDDLPVCLL